MGRPAKKGQSVPLKVMVPEPLWSYLTLLAEKTVIGGSESEVALFLLKQRVIELQREKFHEVNARIEDEN